jgi:hypothetical protein
LDLQPVVIKATNQEKSCAFDVLVPVNYASIQGSVTPMLVSVNWGLGTFLSCELMLTGMGATGPKSEHISRG